MGWWVEAVKNIFWQLNISSQNVDKFFCQQFLWAVTDCSSSFPLIIPLLIAIGMVVGQGSAGRKLGRGRVDQEVEHHLLPRHTPQNPTTFPYIPAHFPTHFPFWAERHRARRARRGLGKVHCAVAVASRAILQNPTQPFTHLRVSQSYSSLPQSYIFLQFPQIWQNLLKRAEKSWNRSQAMLTHWESRERGRGANILQVSTYIRSHTFDNLRIVF